MGVWQLFPISGFSRYTMGIGAGGSALNIKEEIKMYKIVWLNTEVEPVPGFRADSKENAQKLVEAWNINFASKQEVIEA